MTLPGGPANKRGNSYEALWTVSEYLGLLRGETDSIRIEDLGYDKAEFVVRTGQRREFHQAKRSHGSGKWSLTTLSSDGLLREMGDMVAGKDDRFVFVSGSNARDLADLCEAANDAESAEEFAGKFLKSSKRKKASFDRLRREWECDLQTALDRLRRILVRTIDEGLLREKVLSDLRLLFSGKPHSPLDAIRAVVDDSVHRTRDRAYLVEHLNGRGHRLRTPPNPENARTAIRQVTAHYLSAAGRQLIRRPPVPRGETTTSLLSRLADTATDSVVIGRAGTGKTAYIVGITEALQSRGWPVLTFRLDRVDASVSTTDRLGQSLNLEESPALVLGAAAEAAGCPGVLIVDQLDAVGSASGRSTAAFEMVEAMLHEARGQRQRVVIHTVVVCRSFDWQHDHRLRRLLPPDSSEPVEIAEFGVDQVKEILVEADYDVTHFRNRQLKLLRLPQNLALFLEAGFDRFHAHDFKTAKELFDRYWDVKRQLVAERSAPAPDHWIDVIEALSDQMTEAQQLSIPKESLDRFPAEYVRQLASEGVVTIDGHRCGFGHESFFDYCFARLFFARRDHLVGFLKQSEQLLFRRAQVRQVLTYQRDADHARYISELQALLTDGGIRAHIKDLAIALLAEVAKPTEKEWQVRMQLVGPALDARERAKPNPDKLSDIAWRHFFRSKSWFDITCQHGLVNDWLASGNDTLADDAVRYLTSHAEHSPERAVALLEPYASHGGDWSRRLRSVPRGHYANRRLFDFCLQLIDIGAFDGGGESFMGTFFGLDERHAERFAQALAHWLRRRLAISQGTDDVLIESVLFGDYADASTIIKASEAAPAAFVQHILPVVLDISDACAVGGTPPKDDTVWRASVKTDYPSGAEACLSALADALATTARESVDDLREVIGTLRERDTHVANHLLLALYGGGATKLADEAAGLLCEQPWRVELQTEAIRVVVPHCSAEGRKRLEDMILGYVSPYERTKHGFRYTGSSRFDLLSAIPPELRSPIANAHFKELERKFGEPDNERAADRGETVASPIGEDAVNRMTDDQWLRAFGKYDSEDDSPSIDPFKGGAHELAQAFERRVKEEPERFARLCLKVPADALYLDHALSALKDSDVSTNLKIEVCRQALESAFERCGSSIAMVLGRIKDPLPDEAVRMLHRLFVESKDGGILYAGDLYAHSRTVCGSVAEAVRDLILTDAAYVDRFRPTLERMVCGQSPAVLYYVAGAINAVGYFDAEYGVSLFKRMDLSEDRLLATGHMESFFRNQLRDSFVEVRPFIERMLRSAIANVRQAGARLAGLAVLTTNEAEHLFDEAAHGSSHHRLGLAQVAATYVASPEYRGWCEGLLPTLFNDDDGDVRREAASCFRQLDGTALETYGGLIRAFSESRASQEHAFAFLHTLEKSLDRLPGLTCEVCAKLASRPDTARRQLDTHILVKLAFRVYQQHQDDEWTSKALDLIDLLCLDGSSDVAQELEDFER